MTYSFTDNYHYGADDTNFNNPYDDPNGSLTTTYQWWDSAKQSQVIFNPSGNGYSTSNYFYDANGRVSTVTVADIRPRTITLVNNMDGQILERIDNGPEALDPRDVSYYFAGVKIGGVTNNGTDGVDYAETIGNRGFTPGTGQFRNGSTYAAPFADFDQNYDIINPASDAATAGSYTVAEGDTLQTVAMAVWGDASLWYLIADANGLISSDGLVAGMSLVIPNKVVNVHNDSGTFRVYDPNEALGNITPTQPKPPPKSSNGCGPVGTIIVIIVAIVAAYYLGPVALAAAEALLGSSVAAVVVAGAVTGAVASAVSQGVGVAIGAQEEFSWNAVAMGAISGAVGAGLGLIPEGAIGGNPFFMGAARGAAGSVISQGVGVATGVQDNFSWSSVAVAGVVGGVTEVTSGSLNDAANSNARAEGRPVYTDTTTGMESAGTAWNYGGAANQALSGLAGSITGAATRSLLEGSDFGDNLMAALPDIIGQTVGNMIVAQLRVPTSQEQGTWARDGEDPIGDLIDGIRNGEQLSSITVTPDLGDGVLREEGALFLSGSGGARKDTRKSFPRVRTPEGGVAEVVTSEDGKSSRIVWDVGDGARLEMDTNFGGNTLRIDPDGVWLQSMSGGKVRMIDWSWDSIRLAAQERNPERYASWVEFRNQQKQAASDQARRVAEPTVRDVAFAERGLQALVRQDQPVLNLQFDSLESSSLALLNFTEPSTSPWNLPDYPSIRPVGPTYEFGYRLREAEARVRTAGQQHYQRADASSSFFGKFYWEFRGDLDAFGAQIQGVGAVPQEIFDQTLGRVWQTATKTDYRRGGEEWMGATTGVASALTMRPSVFMVRGGSSVIAAEGVGAQSFSRARITKGFQDHHIVSDKNPLTMNHELLDLSGYNLQSRSNKMFLPKTAATHPTRSIHSGRHLNSVSENLADQMDAIVRVGRDQGWSQTQYRQAMDAMVAQERVLLRSGDRALNKNAR